MTPRGRRTRITGGVLRPRISLRSIFPVDQRQSHPVATSLGASTLNAIGTHYEILGVPVDASVDRIRTAYRDRARRYHPDLLRGDGADVMAAVNEAYRVLGDPGRRAAYDRALRGPRTTAAPFTAGSAADDDPPLPSTSPSPSRLMPAGPAKVPWKFMLVAAVSGSALVLAAAAFTDAPADEVPDGILRTGSCVSVEPNGDVREIACTGLGDDVVVDLVIPTDAQCPADMGSFRDRLGLGTVCIGFDR